MLEEHGLGGVMWCMVLEEHGEVVCGECECTSVCGGGGVWCWMNGTVVSL
jgi:hypothetical protein